MDDWQPIETAPKDGKTIRLKGTYFRSEIVTEVDGCYDAGGYTEGWTDDRGNWFYPIKWSPIPPFKIGD